ncbi:hypothetical protein Ga0100231_005195 [Opitutaceae bacterium TAV4]|nr:hypothetical protein Ga0100231_005195 [Opitutaceae bacterium TAV4]
MDHNQNSQGGERADRDKLQLKKHSRYAAERITDRMAWRLAAQIPVPASDTFAVVVFNPLSWRRSGIVQGRAVVYGTPRSSDIAAFRKNGLRLVNDRGETVPYVPLVRHEGLSITLELAFHADTIPAAGYRTWYLVPGYNPIDNDNIRPCEIRLDKENEKNPEAVWNYSTDASMPIGPRRNIGSDQYRNPHYDLTIDRVTGDLTLADRATGKVILNRMAILGVEERGGNYIADMTPSGRTFPALIDTVETLDNNALWCRLRITGSVYGMPFRQTLTLPVSSPEIQIENEIHWTGPRSVRLQQTFPWAGPGNTIRYGVPFGHVTYPGAMVSPNGSDLGRQGDEIPAEDREKMRLCQHWVDIGDDTGGLTIAADHRMWEIDPKNSPQLRAYMIRGINHCTGAVIRDEDDELHAIARPPAGDYTFRYILRPRHAAFADSAGYRRGWELNRPALVTAVGGRNAQTSTPLPTSDSLLDLTDTTLVTTAIKKAEDSDALVIRAFEATGHTTTPPPPPPPPPCHSLPCIRN